MKKLLFVDDDIEVLKLNQKYFQEQNYTTDIASNHEEALTLMCANKYACIILDICMEDTDGLSLCKQIRQTYETPIIFLSNMTEEEYLIEGFQSGADDYMTKPFSLQVLELRIQARIRDSKEKDKGFGHGICLVPTEKQAYYNGVSLCLTANEYEILQLLKENRGTPYSQEDIYHALWGECFYNTHSIQVMVMRIRKKIKSLSPDQEYIKTQWGKGYVYVE